MNSKFFLTSLILVTVLASCELTKKQAYVLGSGIGVNNPTLTVQNIDSAVTYFKDNLGFRVGGIGPNGEFEGALSATINFGDMTSFEILAISDSADQDHVSDEISTFLENHQGIQRYALSTSSIDSTLDWFSSQGFLMDSVNSFRTSEVSDGWARDDGTDNRKSLYFDNDKTDSFLPHLIQNTTFDYATVTDQWRTYYSYRRMYRKHANGVVGIAAIKLAVEDLKDAERKFFEMGFEQIGGTESSVSFSLFRNQELQLFSAESDAIVAEFLEERGEGVFALQYEVEDLDSTNNYFSTNLIDEAFSYDGTKIIIDSDFAFGVQLEFVNEPAEQGEMAEMMSITGKLDPKAVEYASNIYTKYCALCHGDNREGYANDHAPSLRSQSLLATSMNNNFMRYTIQFGRANTAMAGYLDTHGGPLEYIDIEILLKWLYEEAGVEEAIDPSREPVYGDIANGAAIYAQSCASCHGEKGEGIVAPALGNPMTLATATDHFLRYAIAEGRDGTPMMAFKDSLSESELDDVTAFLRSRASGWDVPEPSDITVPDPEDYVLNPNGEDPEFTLRDGKFVSAEQVDVAMKEGKKMIIMDARSEVAWRQTHIPGSFPVPYYEEPDSFIHDIPNDGTQIVIYCACPHAASLRVMNTLNRYGYDNVSIIDEGILVWAQMGLPVRNGR